MLTTINHGEYDTSECKSPVPIEELKSPVPIEELKSLAPIEEKKIDPKQDLIAFRKSINVRALSGLRNIGNTCYMNSALQCISATYPFVANILKKRFSKDLVCSTINTVAYEERKKRKLSKDSEVEIYVDQIRDKYKSSMTYNLFKLLRGMWEQNQEITPRGFKETVETINPDFQGYRQHDSQEFLSFVLDRIHEELKTDANVSFNKISDEIVAYDSKKKEFSELINSETITALDKEVIKHQYKEFKQKYVKESAVYNSYIYLQKYLSKNNSIISDLFTGLFYSETICSECNERSQVFEPYNILSLSIPETGVDTIMNCLATYTSAEELTGENKYRCGECKKLVNAVRKSYIWETPDVLIIQLKRFQNVGTSMRKINSTIKFPMNNLSFDKNYCEYNTHDHKYSLYGVIQHMGSLSGGHYVSFTKNPINNKWYYYNDNNIVHVPDDKIEDQLLSSNNYILFYMRDKLVI